MGNLSKSSLLMLVASISCRGLSDVYDPPPQEPTPEYLGRFSGVYEGLIGTEAAKNRIVMVQLGDRVLFSPIAAVADGPPNLSMFANVLPLASSDAVSLDFGVLENLTYPTRVVLGTDMLYDGANGAGCFDQTPAHPYPTTLAGFGALMTACAQGPGPCEVPCIMPNKVSSDLETWLAGDCLEGDQGGAGEGGGLCAFEASIGGRLTSDAVELYFRDGALVPPAGAQRIECPAPPPDAPAPWFSCMRYTKLCDFDSRYAGVYATTLVHADSNPLGATPPFADLELDLAVAVARNLDAVVLFSVEPAAGASAAETRSYRFMFGPLERSDMSFAARDTGGSIQYLRLDPTVGNEVEAQLVEDLAAGVVGLDGTWILTDANGAHTYELQGSRQTGVEGGTACGPLGTCTSRTAVCPFDGLPALPIENRIESATDDAGCAVPTCSTTLDASRFCAAPELANGGWYQEESGTYELLVAEVECPDGGCGGGGVGCCDPWDRCVRIRAPVAGDEPNSVRLAKVAADCGPDSPSLNLTIDEDVELRITCGAPLDCPYEAPRCPLGWSGILGSVITPFLDNHGCPGFTCQHGIDVEWATCADAVTPSCEPGEAPWPSVRPGVEGADCLEYVCKESCVAACQEQGGQACANPPVPLPDCAPNPVVVTEGWGGCLEVRCADHVCTTPPAVCPLGYGYPPNDMDPYFDDSGCIVLECRQAYGMANLCPDVDPYDGSTPLGCAADEVPLPFARTGTSCVEYQCRPSCEASCPDGAACTDPVLDDAACLNGGNAIHAFVQWNGCVSSPAVLRESSGVLQHV